MTSEPRILLIRTGGTMDSVAYADPRNPPEFVETLKGDDSLIHSTIATFPNHAQIDEFHWGAWEEQRFVKDSQKFTQDDMKALAETIRNDRGHQFFVLPHGTDWMAKNASMLKKELAGSDKTVLFAGAMVPLSMHEKHGSDGVAMLRYAMENVTSLPPGVYVTGRDSHSKRLGTFDPDTVEKDRDLSKADLQFTLKSNAR